MRTIAGLYNRFEDAQAAVRDLLDAGFDKNQIDLIARDTKGQYSRYFNKGNRDTYQTETLGTTKDMGTTTDQGSNVGEGTAAGAGIGAVLGGLGGLLLGLGTLAIPGIGPVLAAGPIVGTLVGAGAGAVTGGIIGALVGLGIPEEHAHAYAEGIRRGGTLVVVRAADENADKAIDILRQYNPVDINKQISKWQKNNWKGFNEKAAPVTTNDMEFNRETNIPVTGDRDVNIPVVEEELEVGKRRVNTGGVEVHSYVKEEPVEKDVELRREHVDVERKPVNRPATDKDLNAFKEGTMEFTESEEEVVAQKRPRVVEEVHIDKDVDTETKTIRETLRKMVVDVDQIAPEDFKRYESDFRNNFNTNYGSRGMNYNDYRPAYQFGYGLGRDRRFNNYDWNRMEPEARSAWEQRYGQGTWNNMREPVRYAWEASRR